MYTILDMALTPITKELKMKQIEQAKKLIEKYFPELPNKSVDVLAKIIIKQIDKKK